LEILLVRHAESEGNLRGVMQGHVDYPLSDLGRQQAACVADYLKNHYSQAPPDFFLASPLKRAFQTAETIAHALSISNIPTDSQLIEVSSGIFSGLTWSEALELHPEICAEFKQVRDWSAVPEGESRASLWERARTFLDHFAASHPPQARGVIVTHGGFIRALLGVVAGVSPAENVFICIDNTSLSLIGLEGSRRYIRYVNRTQHLADCDFSPDFVPK
jgi:broad specificity phosphatase PhoE